MKTALRLLAGAAALATTLIGPAGAQGHWKASDLFAFDGASGAMLWEFPTNSGVLGQPSSFTIDGRQYVAVQSGWGIDSRAMQARLNALLPGQYPEVPEGGAIWVFGLK